MERNGQLLRFALCLVKIKIECNDGITFWLWVVLDEKREGKSREEKFFILWRGVVALFLDLLHSSQKSSHQPPQSSSFLGTSVIFWHYVVCTM